LCQYILDAQLGFLWNTPLPVHLQPTKLSDTQALPTSWLGIRADVETYHDRDLLAGDAISQMSKLDTGVTADQLFQQQWAGL